MSKKTVFGITIEMPGKKQPMRIADVVLDFNGTLATDGRLIRGVVARLRKLAEQTNVIVMTADTFGTARRALSRLPVEVRIVNHGSDKRRFVESLGWRNVAAIGNGVNDVPMLRKAGLGIAVIGDEGAAGMLLREATVVVQNINAALDILLKPKRLVATLRR
jgi:P-type E1-E2 ATPase